MSIYYNAKNEYILYWIRIRIEPSPIYKGFGPSTFCRLGYYLLIPILDISLTDRTDTVSLPVNTICLYCLTAYNRLSTVSLQSVLVQDKY